MGAIQSQEQENQKQETQNQEITENKEWEIIETTQEIEDQKLRQVVEKFVDELILDCLEKAEKIKQQDCEQEQEQEQIHKVESLSNLPNAYNDEMEESSDIVPPEEGTFEISENDKEDLKIKDLEEEYKKNIVIEIKKDALKHQKCQVSVHQYLEFMDEIPLNKQENILSWLDIVDETPNNLESMNEEPKETLEDIKEETEEDTDDIEDIIEDVIEDVIEEVIDEEYSSDFESTSEEDVIYMPSIEEEIEKDCRKIAKKIVYIKDNVSNSLKQNIKWNELKEFGKVVFVLGLMGVVMGN